MLGKELVKEFLCVMWKYRLCLLCGNMESETSHITTGFGWVVVVCFLCMEIWKTGFPTLPHDRVRFFLLSFSRHAEEKKS